MTQGTKKPGPFVGFGLKCDTVVVSHNSLKLKAGRAF